MTSLLTKFVARKIFAETPLGKKSNGAAAAPPEDPYFDHVPATRLGHKTTKKVRKAMPPGLTVEEERVLSKVKRRAYRLDLALFSACGLRFGWSSVIGLIPFIGDFGDMLLALVVYRTACAVEPPLSTNTKMRMQLNIVLDFIIGLVPFIGDVADAAYKCNTRNAVLLEAELRERGQKRMRQSGEQVDVDPSLGHEFDRHHATATDGMESGVAPPRYSTQKQRGRDGADLEAARVEAGNVRR